MIRPPTIDVQEAPELPGYPRLEVGTVVGTMPGSNRLVVRGTCSGNRSYRNVIASKGVTFRSGDQVLLAIIPAENTSIAVMKLDRYSEHAVEATNPATSMIRPPANFSVTKVPGGILAVWDSWPGMALCYQVQHNSTGTSEGASNYFTFGSSYMYQITYGRDTRYFRARSVYFDTSDGYTYASGWTEWLGDHSADPFLFTASEMYEMELEMDYHIVHGGLLE